MKLGRSDRVAGRRHRCSPSAIRSACSQTVTHGIVSATEPRQPRRRDLRELHPDRCGHQRGQLRRRAGERARRADRHQYRRAGQADQGAEGIGVAIPVDLVRGVMGEILQHGRVIRGWIGIDAVRRDARAVARLYGLPLGGVVLTAVRGAIAGGGSRPAARRHHRCASTITSSASAQDAMTRIARRQPGST